MLNGSWIVVSRATGRPVLETFSSTVAAKINRDRYEVITALEWLGRYNRAVKLAGGVEPTYPIPK